MSVDIEYNGSSVATIGAGQRATLSCRGKLMEGDVVISSPESDSCEVTYKGNKIADVPMGARVTIHTKGKQMEDDVVIEVVNSILALDSPTISLEGDILTITDESGLAEEFDIIVGGEVKATVEAVVEPDNPEEPDTQTLTVVNTNNTAETASFTMPIGYTFEQFIGSEYDTSGGKLSTDGVNVWYDNNITYYDSELNYILFIDTSLPNLPNRTYYYAGESATYQLSGTWVFNKTINVVQGLNQKINFRSDYSYSGFGFEGNTFMYYDDGDFGIGGTTAYVNNSWYANALRNVTFNTEQTVSKDFYEWLIANAVKEGNITFTISITTYQAEEGMTWGEWVESEYNTGGYYVYELDTGPMEYVQRPDVETTYAQRIYNGDSAVNATDKIIPDKSYLEKIVADIHSGGSNE